MLLRWHDKYAKFCEDQFRHPKVTKEGGYTCRHMCTQSAFIFLKEESSLEMKLNMPFESSLVMFLALTSCKLSYIKVDLGEIGWGGVDWIGLV
jgi:hypothetical protein